MQWNEYLAVAISWMIVLIPLALITCKLGYSSIRWRTIWLAALILSWMVSVGYFWAFPPDNGFASVLARMFGWLTMMPVLGFLSLLLTLARRWSDSKGARIVAILLTLLVFALPISACFRWLPEIEAKKIATQELMNRGHTEFTIGHAQRTWDGWTIHVTLPSAADYPVYLSRSGFISGIGG